MFASALFSPLICFYNPPCSFPCTEVQFMKFCINRVSILNKVLFIFEHLVFIYNWSQYKWLLASHIYKLFTSTNHKTNVLGTVVLRKNILTKFSHFFSMIRLSVLSLKDRLWEHLLKNMKYISSCYLFLAFARLFKAFSRLKCP